MKTKSNNIIFIDGKEKILQKMFSESNFGYLAVGYYDGDDNGFFNYDPESESVANGFNEISMLESSTYSRIPLSFHSIVNKDVDNGKITAKFTAELDADNIIENVAINQIAIVDSQDREDASTTFFAAAVTETFPKNEKLSLVFVIELTM